MSLTSHNRARPASLRRRVSPLVALLLVAGACGDGDDTDADEPSGVDESTAEGSDVAGSMDAEESNGDESAGEEPSAETTNAEEPAGTADGCATLTPIAAAVIPTLPDGLPCPDGGADWTVGILHVGDCPYCSLLLEAYEEQAASLGVTAIIRNGQLKPELQAQQMDELISLEPDIIVAVPIDTKALIPGLARAQEAGIPVVNATIKTDEAGDEYVVGYVGIDDVLAGSLSAEVMLDGLSERGVTSGTVAIVAGGAGGSEVLRTQGFKETMAEMGPEFEVVGPEYTDFTKEQALAKSRDIISRVGDDLVGMWGEDDTVASGVAQAVADAGLSDTVVVVGMNGNQAGITNIIDGTMYGTVLQHPTIDAAWSVIYAVDVLEGKTPDDYIALEQPKITADNVEAFAPGW